jgi:hypothetical protein
VLVLGERNIWLKTILLAKAQTSGNIDTASGSNPKLRFDKNITEYLGCLHPNLMF